MNQYYLFPMDSDPSAAVRDMLRQLLEKEAVQAVLAPARTPYGPLPMPTLATSGDGLAALDPLAPAAPFNSARQAAQVTRRPTGRKTALVLRPCEIRAWVELTKLNQCAADDALIIGMECLGRMENRVYLEFAAAHEDPVKAFYGDPAIQEKVAETCRSCRRFVPSGADLVLCPPPAPDGPWCLKAETDTGEDLAGALGLERTDSPAGREAALDERRKARETAEEKMMDRTAAGMADPESFQRLVAACLNCYNCRTACPVCYCRECVFSTDVFDPDPGILLRRADRRGAVKLPTDTTMFHLTRMAHMAHACVACGHCSSVCPSDIPVADVFRTVARQVQKRFDYEPGRDPAEMIPYLAYKPAEERKMAG